ncbi:MAG: P22 phage major capsid protein family protein [Bacteroidota bacterium]
MKKISAFLFNMVATTLLLAVVGLPVVAAPAVALITGFLPTSGGLMMALQVEIWEKDIVSTLFADNTFLSKAFNADQYVLAGKVVHIPQAGAPSAVVKNRAVLPAVAVKRTDTEISYALDEYTTTPRVVQITEEIEASYDKRQSVIVEDKDALLEAVSEEFIDKWSPEAAAAATCYLRTTGAVVAAHLPSATGNRLALTVSDVSDAQFKMNSLNIPKAERYALIDSWMYKQLLTDMTASAQIAFHAGADIAKGTIGKLHGFEFYERSSVTRYTNAATPVHKTWDTAAAATDNAAAIFWQKNSVERAKGEVVAFDNAKDATYYGDVLSFLVRAGGRIRRADNKGVVAMIQTASA